MTDVMELICTKCDGLGEERIKLSDVQPWFNVAGWHHRYDLGYIFRRCEPCNGEGFRPTGTIVPVVARANAGPTDRRE